MRKLALLPLLALALACGDGSPLQPDDQASPTSEQPQLVAYQAPGQNAKWSVHAIADNPVLQGLDDVWITPSGIAHYSGLVNRFDMWGDLTGSAWFIGDFHSNTRSARGVSQARPFLFDVTSSVIGKVGSFECVGTFKLIGYPGPEFVQYGNLAGCHGNGDFEGMSMKGYTSNELHPGTGIYDIWFEIW